MKQVKHVLCRLKAWKAAGAWYTHVHIHFCDERQLCYVSLFEHPTPTIIHDQCLSRQQDVLHLHDAFGGDTLFIRAEHSGANGRGSLKRRMPWPRLEPANTCTANTCAQLALMFAEWVKRVGR